MDITRLAVAVNHDLCIIVEIRHGPIADDDVVSHVNGHIKVARVIKRVDREARISWTIRGKKMR
jgi:hypothetical protein